YYSFDNDTIADGGIQDISGNNRDGSGFDRGSSGITYSFSNDVAAAIGSGQSLDLNNTEDFVISDTPGYNGVSGASARTVAGWVKINSIPGNTTLVEWGANTNGQRWAFRVQDSTGSDNGNLRIEVAGDFAIGNTAINDGQWHHVAVVFSNDGTPVVEDSLLYIDGVLDASAGNFSSSGGGSPAINTGTTNQVTVGSSQIFTDNREVGGLMDEFGVWSRALSSQEIADLASGTVVPEPSSLALLGLGGLLIARRRRG
ncbi:MAG: LamG domain-containing protein, partial [Planctomycetota bacterium]